METPPAYEPPKAIVAHAAGRPVLDVRRPLDPLAPLHGRFHPWIAAYYARPRGLPAPLDGRRE